MFKKILLFSLFAFATLFSCNKEAATPTTYSCTGITPTYTNTIKAIMNGSCAIVGCHDAVYAARGVDLSSYQGVKAIAASPYFLGTIEQLSGYNPMPQGAAKLPDATIQKIYCWVQNGEPQ
jgi:hypothetical protein